jgi:copper(I)-binding protein
MLNRVRRPRADARLATLPVPLAAALLAVLICAAPAVLAHEFKLGDLQIIHPWSRATPGGAKVAAGYVLIRNEGAEPDRLISAAAEVAGGVMIHEMTMSDGVMSMRMLPDGVVIPAHGEIALKPGSYHLMLDDLKQPLKEGESFNGSFTFEKAGTIDVTFLVEAIGARSPAGEDPHRHGDGL